MRKIVYAFCIWRIFLFLPLVASQLFLRVRSGFDYTTPLHYINSYNPISQFLLYPWANFDGIYYLTIAGSGYTVDNAGFFPLFPFLINVTSSIFGNVKAFDPAQFLAALILVSILFLLSLILFHKLIRIDYNKEISFQSILFLLLFPVSFFLATIYSESLFFLLLVLSFYFARKDNWAFSAIFAMLLTATRLVGVAIIPALIFEFYIQNKTIVSKKNNSTYHKSFGHFVLRLV